MFGWAAMFFILAALAACLEFSLVLGGLTAIFVRLLLIVFLSLLAGSDLLGLIKDEPPI